MDEHVVGPNDNVFESLGFDKEEAANLLIRSNLMIEITKFIQTNKLSLRKAGEFFGVNHSRINDILKGDIDKFTIDYLVNLISKTGGKVTVQIEMEEAS